jgi:probable phosphoglycerate mutase
LTPIRTALLREQGLGELEGLTTQDASARLADVDLANPAARYGGGESRLDVAGRIAALLAGPLLGGLGPSDQIVMVSHGDTIRVAVALLLGEDLARAPWRTIENGSVTTVASRAVRVRASPIAPMAAVPATSNGHHDR